MKTIYEVEVSISSIKINKIEYDECYQECLDKPDWYLQGGGVRSYFCETRNEAKKVLEKYIISQTDMMKEATLKYLLQKVGIVRVYEKIT